MKECDRNLTVLPILHILFTRRTILDKVVSPQVPYPKRQMNIN
jgi:hypothetical protein